MSRNILIYWQLLVMSAPGLFLQSSWWRNEMETFSALLAFVGNSPVTGEFLAQRPVTRSLDVFFYLRLNKQLNKQSWGWWFETLSHSTWRHCNGTLNGFQAINDSLGSHSTLFLLNSLWHSDIIWRHRSGSTLAQAIACCLMALSYCLNQCWLIFSTIKCHSSQHKGTRAASIMNY